MTSPKLATALLTAGLLATRLVAPTAAQAPALVQLAAPPTLAGTFDIATGTLTPPSPPGLGDSTTTGVLYDNTADNGSYFLPGTAVYTMDWGTPSFGGNGATVTAIQIAYGTTKTSGLVSLAIRLHQGATGSGFKGTDVLNALILNLPNSPDGQPTGYIIDATLPTPVALPDGPLGWSYQFVDAQTGPLLVGPPNAAGVVDALDRYLAANDSYVDTITFTGNPPPFASLHLQLTGRANNPQPNPWVSYGSAGGMTLTASGPATPGSSVNQIHLSGTKGKKAVLVVGLTQSSVTAGVQQMTFYALPWIVMLPDIPLSTIAGTATLPATIPSAVPSGTKIDMQAFGQSLVNIYNKYSAGLELTVQ